MTSEQALSILDQVTQGLSLSRVQHAQIIQALETLRAKLLKEGPHAVSP